MIGLNGLHCVLSPLATPIISSHVEMNDVWVAALIGPAIRHPPFLGRRRS